MFLVVVLAVLVGAVSGLVVVLLREIRGDGYGRGDPPLSHEVDAFGPRESVGAGPRGR